MAKQPQKELGGTRQMSTSTRVIIAIFAVVMALSMMLPSLASIFASDNAAEQAEEAAAQAQESESEEAATEDEDSEEESSGDEASDKDKDEDKDGEGSADDADAEVPDNETLKSYADTYGDQVKPFEERLEADPKDLAALLNLGQIYMNWGYSSIYSSSTDEETTYSNGLLSKAIEYYDRYLAINDSNAVKVDRALCQFYRGDSQEAIDALVAICDENPDYPLAWANLGMLYESQYDTENANEAYRKAIETDAKDEYGAKSYANQRLISLNSTVDTPADAGDASADEISTAPESGLTSTLASDSGIGF